MTTARYGLAAVNGTHLAYEVIGDGRPIVLVHGLALDRRMWDDQVEALAERHRVVRYDLRGFGGSADPRTGEEYSHADDLRALLTHLDISRAALMGLSLGGWVVLESAITYPEAVSALVLVDALVRRYSFPHGWTANLQRINRVAKTDGLQKAKDLWLADPVFERSREIPEVAARLRRMVADYRGWQFLHENPHREMDPPAIERLGDVAIPALVIVGERDLPDFLGMARLLVTEIPRADLVTIPGAGHMSNMDAPAQFTETVLSFLAQSHTGA